ncbi:hypothetical protein FPZ24_07380 [Sphingomonas panacisoli]|uniref:Phage shock protein B n=1 Tax=Sphingomonas panacisoli TaxID=1813879 RepID=A0A5B8LH09_9SPHN|nr:hypothetical protein [Sphingomonas panacisoli]QDZ07321.1 hypothetical protein FPZ24_07380 [Sphingomonas panacisoli]
MNPFEMVIAIVAIVTIGGIIRARMGVGRDNQGNEFSLRNDAAAAENRQLREDIRGLKERIAVLERVITDTNTSSTLDREIEKLRDTDR